MSAAEQAEQCLVTLLELTPEPAQGEDPGLLIEKGMTMLSLREEVLDLLKTVLAAEPEALKGNMRCKEIRDTLVMRDTRWNDAMSWARGELARRRLAGQRARQAQRGYQKIGAL